MVGAGGFRALAADASPSATPAARPAFRTKLHKAMIVSKLDEDTLRPYKEAGFEGVEVRASVPTPRRPRVARWPRSSACESTA
jgi:hypothetical protein